MSKQLPKRLRYAGIEYEAVPTMVRYAGKTYVIAQDPFAPGKAGVDLPALPPAAAGDLGAELGREQAPPLPGGDPDAPMLPTQTQLLKEEEVQKALQPMIEALNVEAQKYLQAVGIQTSGDFTVEAIERDGLDLKVPIKAGNFAAIPGDTAVYFDFMVKLPGAEELEQAPRGEAVEEGPLRPPGEWMKGEHLMLDKLAYGVVNVLRGLKKQLEGTKTLQEVSVGICGKFLVSPAKGAEPLLESLAFLQNKTKVEPGELLSVPKGKPGGEDSLAWFAAFVRRLREGDLNRAIRQRWSEVNWLDPKFMIEMMEVLSKARIITKAQADTVIAIKDTFNNDQEYGEFVREAIEGTGGGVRASREAVEKAVRQLAAHEGYKANAPVHVGTDPQDGNIIARIDAPGNPTYVFRKGAGGSAEPQLLWAGVELCGYKWKVTNARDAAQLLTAVADVAEASANSIDAALNQDHKEMKEADIARMLFKQLSESQKAVQEGTAAQTPRAPTGLEMFNVPTTGPGVSTT